MKGLAIKALRISMGTSFVMSGVALVFMGLTVLGVKKVETQ